jgi:hypothetical protein
MTLSVRCPTLAPLLFVALAYRMGMPPPASWKMALRSARALPPVHEARGLHTFRSRPRFRPNNVPPQHVLQPSGGRTCVESPGGFCAPGLPDRLDPSHTTDGGTPITKASCSASTAAVCPVPDPPLEIYACPAGCYAEGAYCVGRRSVPVTATRTLADRLELQSLVRAGNDNRRHGDGRSR